MNLGFQQAKAFVQKRKWAIVCIIMVSIILYLPKMANFTYSIDSERMAINPTEVMNSWIRIGRFGLVLLKHFFLFGTNLNPFFINGATYLLLAISAILLLYIFDQYVKAPILFKVVAVLIYLVSPIHFEQTNFVLQSVEVLIGYNLLFAAIIVLHPFKKVTPLQWLLGIFLMAFSFSIYPSLVVASAMLLVIINHLFYMGERSVIGVEAWLRSVIRPAISFMLSLVAYFVANRIVLFLMGATGDSYMYKSALWGKIRLTEVLNSIANIFVDQFISLDKPFYLSTVTYLGIFALLVLGLSNIRRAFFNWPVAVSIVLEYILVISPLILLGNGIGPIRTLTPTIPLALMVLVFTPLFYAKSKSLQMLLIAGASILIILQLKTTSDLEQTDILEFQNETKLANQIVTRINEKGIFEYTDYTLVVVGGQQFKSALTQYGEVIGHTHFDWDNLPTIGNNHRIHDFLASQGYHFKGVTPKVYAKAQKFIQVNKLRRFPATDGIEVIGRTIIVNLQ
ncbi:glucosyltransferase domain-containing protein [Lacticaseibacillus rhamnosus]|uniref:glucosyltransferase domain-containing protein n=1 Tax=Lacticaseibacillus rhamnosus TaxID=47715 RepID=UPI0023E314B6|nr:glucosyltransferase domain-containing protein [Lacticaseibacillus rhamnosus]MDF3335258.1 glucosyltransferase domain-containing protein [Lacticaseibacillus rhamnosus]